MATFSILHDLLEAACRDDWTVHVLVGRDADVHWYNAAPRDARQLVRAELLVSNGPGVETWLPRLASAASVEGRHVLASDGVAPLLHPGDGGAKAVVDPHCWQDVSLARHYVQNVAAGLAGLDAPNAGAYHERAAELDRRLAALDDWVRNVPPHKRRVITSHDAFGYFSRAYGLNSWRHADAGGFVGPPLYSGALSAPDGAAATYKALMRHNVIALVDGMLAIERPSSPSGSFVDLRSMRGRPGRLCVRTFASG